MVSIYSCTGRTHVILMLHRTRAKSPVSLRVNVVPAIERLNIDCHTNFDADNS